MATRTPITVAHGDGIGPEIMAATLHILEAAGARSGHRNHRDRREGLSARQYRRHRAQRVGFPAPHQSLSQSAHHHAAGRRFQEPQRHHAQDARPVRQHPPLRLLPSVRRHQASRYGSWSSCAKTKRICTPASSIRPRPTRCSRFKLISRPGSRKNRPLRLRIRPPAQPQEGHLLHERQHHEDDRRPVPQGLRRNRRASIRRSRKSTGSSTSARPRWPTRRKPSTSS